MQCKINKRNESLRLFRLRLVVLATQIENVPQTAHVVQLTERVSRRLQKPRITRKM